MKLNVLWELVVGKPLIRINAVEAYAWAGMIVGVGIFLTALLWDVIAGKLFLQHTNGYGWEQILAMAASGLYVFWGWCIQDAWKE